MTKFHSHAAKLYTSEACCHCCKHFPAKKGSSSLSFGSQKGHRHGALPGHLIFNSATLVSRLLKHFAAGGREPGCPPLKDTLEAGPLIQTLEGHPSSQQATVHNRCTTLQHPRILCHAASLLVARRLISHHHVLALMDACARVLSTKKLVNTSACYMGKTLQWIDQP